MTESARIEPATPVAPRHAVGQTKHAILLIINSLLSHGGKHYISPGERAMRKILYRRYKIPVARSTYYEHLSDLANFDFLNRRRRISRDPDGTFCGKKSLLTFTLRGINYLVNRGVEAAQKTQAAIIVWWRRGDKRFPAAAAIIDSSGRSAQSQTPSCLSPLVGSVFKPFPV